MRPESQTDPIALLALRICGKLLKWLNALGRAGAATGQSLYPLVKAVRTPGEGRNLTNLHVLVGNINIAWKHSSLREQQP